MGESSEHPTGDRVDEPTARRLREQQTQLRRLASELTLAEARERRRIAEDLHDHVGQALAMIRNRVADFQGNAVFCGFEDTLAEVLMLLDRTIRYTRDLTGVISPPILFELGLPEALDWLAEREEADHGLHVDLSLPESDLALPEDRKIMFFRSAQELLRNVSLHAGTDRARLTLAVEGGRLRLEIADDGRGFDPAAGRGGDAFGLFSIRERMQQLGGEARVESAPGRGTRVTLTAPLAEEGGR